jgi:signal transduction histidine kinase
LVERELRLYRRLCLFVGAIYLVWWGAVELLLPGSINPLPGRLGVVVGIWSITAGSYVNAWVRDHIKLLWTAGLWLLTAHYYYLFHANGGDINWVVGSFVTVTAVSLAMMSRASLIAYSAFAAALSIALVIALPALRSSVFVPGLLTVLLQANIGLHSRLAVLRDLAASNEERAKQASDLRVANEALARSNLDLQRFAYIASHDLQTPLRSISSFVELLRLEYGAKLDAQAQDWLLRTATSVEHLQTLIRDLLEYSRLETESRPFEKVSMQDVFGRAISLLDAEIREASASVVATDLPDVVGDRSQIVQLLQNLVGNAIKYRGTEAPRVQLTATERADDWLFQVRDNGIGIAAKHHAQVFEIFKRLHDQKEYPGTGIGLAICRRVVDRHGGKIWVESSEGEGSTFFFTLAKGLETHR